jgi:hypothetical protein
MMALIWGSGRLRSLGVLILLSSFVASYELASQKILASDNEPKVEGNATLMIPPREWYGMCSASPTNPSYDEALANNFRLAPEVCLSGTGLMEPRLFLLETAKWLVNGRESPAVLIISSHITTKNAMVVSHSSTPPIIQTDAMGPYSF